jgi:hypothetical protein
MKRHLATHALLSAIVILPALAACKHGSSGGSGGSGGAQPNATPSSEPSADNDDNDNDDDSGKPGGHHGKKAHGGGGGGGDGGGGGGGGGEPTTKIVINKPTPEPMAPPALRKPSAIPPLPSFPERGKYPKEAEVPKGGDLEGCGQVWTGHEYQNIECIDPDVHSRHARLAKVVVPYEKMKQPTDKLPKVVDHRFDLTEGPVRKQGGPQCTAFAFTAGLDHAFARWTGKPGEFSVMQIWARYHHMDEKDATDANLGDYVANESDWPYDAKVANSWLACGHGSKEPCGKKPDEAKLKELSEGHHRVAEITQVEVVPATKFEVLREKIAGGQDVVAALKLPNFATAGEKGEKYIVGTQKGPGKAGHEILLAGYAETPHGTYYLLHNSWGPTWGDDGYAWIHEELLRTHWLDNRIVVPDVQPVEVAALRAHAHGGLVEKCEKDKLPDSISGLCAGKCTEGGPRHNNVCPEEKKGEKEKGEKGKGDKGEGHSDDCPKGFINLTGECVLSAPKGSGTEGKVKWECGLTGCTYEVPKGELDCKDKECQVSCPAPDFRLATEKKGLVCIE